MFVDPEPVRITLPGQEHLSDAETDAMYIKLKMDFGTRQKVMAAGVQMSKDAGAAVGDGVNMAIDIGSYQTAQLIHNIVRWAGPSFGDTPLTPENILRLDPDEPLVALVLREIAQRNTKKASPDPK